jgi:hypothetical protein
MFIFISSLLLLLLFFFYLTNIRAAAVHRFLDQTNVKNITTTVALLMDFLLV